jgi:hypothetical protein
MKITKNIFFICFFLCVLCARSQNGLENIIVEKYYVSDAKDTALSYIGGPLPVGSVTYRIYLDLKPEYRFYAAYGKPGHELKLETTTNFFNNEHIGNKIPNVIPRNTLKQNTVMLDSWLSAGAAGEDYYGILKEQDDAVETIVHEKEFLQNTNKAAGIPVKDRDGLRAGSNIPWPSFFGIDSLVPVFFNKTKGSIFSTANGAWGCLGGAMGTDSLTTNRVLIAQLTTTGDLSFELNLQIGKRNDFPEYYVARNPSGQEKTLPCLIYHGKETKLTASKAGKPATKKINNHK